MSIAISKRRFEYTCPPESWPGRDKVPAIRSTAPGLILCDNGCGYSVTHEGSGMAVMNDRSNQYFSSGFPLRKARLLAGALGGLPIDWTAEPAKLREGWNKMDEAWREWVKRVQYGERYYRGMI